MATAFQGIQVVLQLLATNVGKLDVGDKDSRTLELEAIWNAFATQDSAVSVPRNETLLARVQGTLKDVQAQVFHKD